MTTTVVEYAIPNNKLTDKTKREGMSYLDIVKLNLKAKNIITMKPKAIVHLAGSECAIES